MQSFISNMRIATTGPANTDKLALSRFIQFQTHIYPSIYMRFFVPRLLLCNTATGYAYCPAGNTATLLRYCPLAGGNTLRGSAICLRQIRLTLGYAYCFAIRLRCYAIAPLPGAIRSAVRLFACGKYASQIYTLRSYSKKHQYIAIPKQNVRLF